MDFANFCKFLFFKKICMYLLNFRFKSNVNLSKDVFIDLLRDIEPKLRGVRTSSIPPIVKFACLFRFYQLFSKIIQIKNVKLKNVVDFQSQLSWLKPTQIVFPDTDSWFKSTKVESKKKNYSPDSTLNCMWNSFDHF